MASRWTYSFSNLGPKKQISGTTYYKVSIGNDVRWLSMKGVNMLKKAHDAGVTKATVMKATSYYTGRGTQIRVKKVRTRIKTEIANLMNNSLANTGVSVGGPSGGTGSSGKVQTKFTSGKKGQLYNWEYMRRSKKGILAMADRGNVNQQLYDQMGAALEMMSEDEMKLFWKENQLLLEAYFIDSDELRKLALASPEKVKAIEKNVAQNAQKLLDKMLEIISRRKGFTE